MKRDLFKEYKKNKLRDKEVVFNKEKTFIKLLLFLLELGTRMVIALFYIAIIVLCSIGATFIFNKLGIINIFGR